MLRRATRVTTALFNSAEDLAADFREKDTRASSSKRRNAHTQHTWRDLFEGLMQALLTTKVALIDEDGQNFVVFFMVVTNPRGSNFRNHHDSTEITLYQRLYLQKFLSEKAADTGYGEQLIKNALKSRDIGEKLKRGCYAPANHFSARCGFYFGYRRTKI